MKLVMRVDVDATYDDCEEVLDQLEELVAEGTTIHLGGSAYAAIEMFSEIPAAERGRLPKGG